MEAKKESPVKQHHSLLLLVLVVFGVTLAVAQTAPKTQKRPAPAKKQATSQADLQKEAKITKEEATKTALARVPNGTIKEGELEKEKGKLIWSFDIAKPGEKGITEVQVDAITGKVVSVTHESASAEAAEKKAEQSKPKKPKP